MGVIFQGLSLEGIQQFNGLVDQNGNISFLGKDHFSQGDICFFVKPPDSQACADDISYGGSNCSADNAEIGDKGNIQTNRHYQGDA